MFSREREPCVKRSCLASLTDAALQLLLYISTQKRSSRFMCTESNVRDSGFSVSAFNVSVNYSILFHIPHAVFFPQPRIWDVVSQPLMA